MPRRGSETQTIYVPANDDEGAVVDEMAQRLGFGSRANLVRHALWTLADEMGLDLPPWCFEIRAHGHLAHKRGESILRITAEEATWILERRSQQRA